MVSRLSVSVKQAWTSNKLRPAQVQVVLGHIRQLMTWPSFSLEAQLSLLEKLALVQSLMRPEDLHSTDKAQSLLQTCGDYPLCLKMAKDMIAYERGEFNVHLGAESFSIHLDPPTLRLMLVAICRERLQTA